MNGLSPLTFTTIRHWRKERCLPRLGAKIIDALIELDTVMLSLGVPTKDSE